MKQAKQVLELGNRITRSTIAVIDTVAGRGGFRGEELATIGQLRDQCVALVQILENETIDIPEVVDKPAK
jgi:hypothetical protein